MAKLEPGDYYMENGLLVFTRQFHLKRGNCCRCNCRHCPWRDGRGDSRRGGPTSEAQLGASSGEKTSSLS